MPPPQCPECGRFLATAFVQQITVAAAPCPRCGTALYLGEADEPMLPEGAAPAETEEFEEFAEFAADPIDVVAQAAAVEESVAVEEQVPDAFDDDGSLDTPDVTIMLDEPEVASTDGASVRPIDLADDGTSRDPLAGWDVGPAQVAAAAGGDVDPTALAAGAGAGLAVGLLLGGRDHRGLGAVLGAVLGALLARLRG